MIKTFKKLKGVILFIFALVIMLNLYMNRISELKQLEQVNQTVSYAN